MSAFETHFYDFCFPSNDKFQKPLSLALLAVACFVIITILISLQFPAIMSSPWAALSFGISFSGESS